MTSRPLLVATMGLLLLSAACSRSSQVTPIAQGVSPEDVLDSHAPLAFDSTLDSAKAQQVRQDLAILEDFEVEGAESLREMLELEPTANGRVTGVELREWLGRRVKFLVGESYNVQARVASYRDGFRYDSSVFASTHRSHYSAAGDEKEHLEDRILAENIGAAVYSSGRKSEQLIAIDVAGRWILANSPRVGVVRLRDQFFESTQLNAENLVDESDFETRRKDAELRMLAGAFARISTLFHEARHSDGHGDNVGFPHKPCVQKEPENDSSGRNSLDQGSPKPSKNKKLTHATCDVHLNGPHEIQRLVLLAFLKDFAVKEQDCRSCSKNARHLLDMRLNFAETSLVDRKNATNVDARAERVHR